MRKLTMALMVAVLLTALAPLSVVESNGGGGGGGGGGGVPPECVPTLDAIVGTAGDDVLIGTPGDDLIIGLDGNDRILGKVKISNLGT